MDKKQVIIIGSGPAGLTAAIYNARARLAPLVIAGIAPGGQLMTTTGVENFPGFVNGVQGVELMTNMLKQAERYGAQILKEDVASVDFSGRPLKVTTASGEYSADSILIATGAHPKRLNVEGEEQFWGKGVSTCATCDGAFFSDKEVVVVGGGDAAMEEADFLTRFALKVTVMVRAGELRASVPMQERVKGNEKIQVMFNTEVTKINGEQFVSSVGIKNNETGAESTFNTAGVFLAIGHIPTTGFLGGSIELDERGYIKATDRVKTSVEGVFVAGDVQDYKYRQAISAAGLGCEASLEIEWYLRHLSE